MTKWKKSKLLPYWQTGQKDNVMESSSTCSRVVSPPSRKRVILLLGLTATLLGVLHLVDKPCFSVSGVKFGPWGVLDIMDWNTRDLKPEDNCVQAELLIPSKHHALWTRLGDTYDSDGFKLSIVEWHGSAIRIARARSGPEVFDHVDPVGVDPRWEVFGPFHEYLFRTFPLVHSTLELTKVNTYGLLYHWKGSDPSLKPLLLAAHQDVVPVDPTTVDQWEHPPYSGYFDEERIWGRGSSDDKSGLMGTLISIEMLLKNGFKPTRSVVLVFGFDEEVGGFQGAQQLSKALLTKFGEDTFAMLIDEGGGFGYQYGAVFAVLSVAEKGYLDVRVEVTAPGGHSSVPPPHTSIGILSALLVRYESNPYEARLERTNPIYGMAQCLAAYSPDMLKSLRRAIRRSATSEKALRKAERLLFEDPGFKSFAGTTQAIDIIQGGVKANALPEQAWALINHRISIESSVGEVEDRQTDLLTRLVEKHNLTYIAFGEIIVGSGEDSPNSGSLTLSEARVPLEPSPITPTGADAAPFRLLSGTIKATYAAHRPLEIDSEVYITPGIISGNTDTRYYWKMTDHIFRYNHYNQEHSRGIPGVHTVNEYIKVNTFVEMIRFFTTLILNIDESTEL